MGDINETLIVQIKDLITEMNNAGYEDMTNALENLNTLLKKFYTPDQQGFYPIFDKKQQRELMKAYIAAAGALQEVYSRENLPFALETIAKSVKELLSRDLTVVGTAKPDENTTLPDLIAQARTIRVFAKENDLKANHADGMFNIRIPLKVNANGINMNGFFTAEKHIEGFSASKAKQILQKLKSKNKNLAKRLGAVEKNLNAFFDSLDGRFRKLSDKTMTFSDYLKVAVEQRKLSKNAMEVLNALSDEKHGAPEWREFINDYNGSCQYHHYLNADEQSCITDRNIAMSRIAGLLGLDSLLVKSIPMEVTDEQGNLIKGVFMETAEGKDLKYLLSKDVEKLDKNSPFAPSCIKQAAELQILDFICQNIDRHPRNMCYKFSEDGTKIIGIQGIDNDMSFGTIEKKESTNIGKNDFSLQGLQVISESLKNHLFALNPQVLEYCLQDVGLTNNEISAAIKRLRQIQDAVTDQLIRVVKDEEWNNMTIEPLGNANSYSIFHTLISSKMEDSLTDPIGEKILKKQQADGSLSPDKILKPWDYVETTTVNALDPQMLEINLQKAAAFSERIKISQDEIHGDGSLEFRNLQQCVQAYQNWTAAMKQDESNAVAMQTALNDMQHAAEAYLQKKGNSSTNKKTQRRIEIAKEVQSFAKAKKKEYEESFDQRAIDDKIKATQEFRKEKRENGDVKML